MIEAGVHEITIRLMRPLTTAVGSHDTLDGVIVSFDDGRDRGWGEATPVPGFGVHRAHAIAGHLETLALDVALSPEDPEALLGAVTARFGDVAAARFAATGALLDLLARRSRRSLTEEVAARLDVPYRRAVTSGALLSGDGPDEVGAAAQLAVAEGFDTVKMKVGTATLADDVSRVAAVRSAIGADVRLRLDANGAWDVEMTRTAVEALGPFDIDLLEEPTSGLRALEEVAALVEVPVAVDESIEDLSDLRRAAGAAPAVVVKPARLGGLVAVTRAALALRAPGTRVVVTSLLDGSVARATAAVVAAVAGAEGERHGLSTGRLLDTDVIDPPWGMSPTVRVDEGHGLGFDPDL
jgi:o-succinylbenzoate synthase